MSPKVAIPILAALAFVPAALVAQHNQVRLHAFVTEGAPLSQAMQVASANRPPWSQTLELPPVSISASRTPRSRGAVIADGRPTVCATWRRLEAGPGIGAAAVPMVRWCEGADLRGASEPPPATARIPAPTRAPAPSHQTWRFQEHIGGPR